MLFALMRHCRNYFRVNDANPIQNYLVKDRKIVPDHGSLPALFPGMLYMITDCSSCPPLNGLYMWEGSGELHGMNGDGASITVKTELPYDGVFAFSVIPVNPPVDFIDLAIEMQEWNKAHPDGEFVSEKLSASGYSYTKATGNNGGAATVWDKYAGRIAQYRRICAW